MRHDIEHLAIGLVHRIRTNGYEVAYALFDILVDDALDSTDTIALHSQHGRQDGCADTRGDLERTTRLGSIAYHSGEISDHILDRKGDLLEIAAHQIGDATTRTSGGYDTTAEG